MSLDKRILEESVLVDNNRAAGGGSRVSRLILPMKRVGMLREFDANLIHAFIIVSGV